MSRRAFITNFNGLGNGILTLPILHELEKVDPDFQYFHIYNPVFEISAFRDVLSLHNLQGLTPNQWRRFDHADLEHIKNFLQDNAIDTVINLRDQDEYLDARYMEFKKSMQSSRIEFWDLYEVLHNRSQIQHIMDDVVDLFTLHGLNLSTYRRSWLKDTPFRLTAVQRASKKIGFFTAASLPAKRWTEQSWIELGEMLLHSDTYEIEIYAGTTQEEYVLAHQVHERLDRRFGYRVSTLIENEALAQLAKRFSELDLLISNDTVAVHLASALDVPTIGLHFSTDSRMWKGIGAKCVALQSENALDCPSMRASLGNCVNYYHGCTLTCSVVCKSEVSVKRVFDLVISML